jgi:hypothetical protein
VVEKSAQERLHAMLAGAAGKHTNEKASLVDDAAFAALTIGDLIYDVTRVDPTVLEAADFARAADLSNVFNFATLANHIADVGTPALTGNVAQIQGYVAERLAAQALQSKGMEVLFPATSNQAGYDLLVNGHPFQVKCLDNPDGVLEHINRYPDIPVLINEDIGDQLSSVDNVYPVHGLNHDQVVASTKESLIAGDDMLDFRIPYIALAVAAGRNIYAIVRGQTDMLAALQNIVVDVSGGTAGGMLGSKALAMAGLLIAPHAAVVGGILGSIGGYAGGRRVARWVKTHWLCAQEEGRVEKALTGLLDATAKPLTTDIQIVEQKANEYKQALKDQGSVKTALWDEFGWRIDQELQYLKDKARQIAQWMREPRALAGESGDMLQAAGEGALMPVRCGIHPHHLKNAYTALCDAVEQLMKKRKKHLL